MFGIGHTLMEEMVYEDGQLLNGNLVDYTVPRFNDVPDNLDTILIETERSWSFRLQGYRRRRPLAGRFGDCQCGIARGRRAHSRIAFDAAEIWRAMQAKA